MSFIPWLMENSSKAMKTDWSEQEKRAEIEAEKERRSQNPPSDGEILISIPAVIKIIKRIFTRKPKV